MDLEELLKKNFGHSQFLLPQKELIERVLAKQSSLLIMPTGGGKSLCFQLPALIMEGTALVISPLIALMKDQVDALNKLGHRATFINSSLTRSQREDRQNQLKKMQYDLVFVTPERFRKSEFIEALKSVKISFLAVDEAHCISQWGHDFRPEYARVGEIRKQIGHPSVIALTATATLEVEAEICQILDISKSNVYRANIERPNLAVSVLDLHGLETKADAIEKIIKNVPGPKIVYASLIQSLFALGRELEKRKIRYSIYHGQLQERERRTVQEEFLNSKGGVLLATPAFGLGINKPDIRALIHAEIPNSIEAYFQEIGRAGRDGLASQCALLFDEDDVSIQMDFLKWSNPEPEFIIKVFKLIEKNKERVTQEGADFLRREMNFYNTRDFRVETSLNLLRSWGLLDGWDVQGELTEDMLDIDLRKERLKNQQKKLLSILQWAKAETGCRMQAIYSYFAQSSAEPCGICDLCRRDL